MVGECDGESVARGSKTSASWYWNMGKMGMSMVNAENRTAVKTKLHPKTKERELEQF